MQKNYTDTIEAKAVRARRHSLRRGQGDDPLAKRAGLIAFWRKCAETNPAYRPHNGCWWWVFTWNVAFRDLLMPKLRETARQWARLKAERAAAKARAKLPQLDLLDAVEGAQ